jgi:hypothetical protein
MSSALGLAGRAGMLTCISTAERVSLGLLRRAGCDFESKTWNEGDDGTGTGCCRDDG